MCTIILKSKTSGYADIDTDHMSHRFANILMMYLDKPSMIIDWHIKNHEYI